MQQQPNYLVVDIEGSAKPRHNPWIKDSYVTLVGFGCAGYYDYSVFEHCENRSTDHTESLAKLQRAIDNAQVIVAHNIKFDLNWLKTIGIVFRDYHRFYCTQIAEYLIYGQQKVGYSLNALATRYGTELKIDEVAMLWDQGVDTFDIPLRTLVEYNKRDIEITEFIFKKQVPIIQAAKINQIVELCMDIANILSDSELYGVGFDEPKAIELLAQFDKDLESIDEDLRRMFDAEIDPSKRVQLSAALYGGSFKVDGVEHYTVTLKSGKVKEKSRKCKLDIVLPGAGFIVPDGCFSEKTGAPKTDKNTMAQLEYKTDIQKAILDTLRRRSNIYKAYTTIAPINKKSKAKSGLINARGWDGRLHPNMGMTITATGRLASSKPNGQNFPRGKTSPIKTVLVPKEGNVVVNGDLKQIEWRMAAALCRDVTMITEINDDIDTHTDNACKFFGTNPEAPDFDGVRTTAKIVTFRLLYGGSARGFDFDKRMPSLGLKKWEQIVNGYLQKYTGLPRWWEENVNTVKRQEYLRNPSSRLLMFKKKMNYEGVIVHDKRQIYNYPVQSISTDVMFLLMRDLHREIKKRNMKCRMMLQVHDSMVFDCPKEEAHDLCEMFERLASSLPEIIYKEWGWHIPVKLGGDCEVGLSYGKMKKVKVLDELKDMESFLSDLIDNSKQEPIIYDIVDEDELLKEVEDLRDDEEEEAESYV